MVIRQSIVKFFDEGILTPQSQLTDVPGIGPYTEGQLRRSLNRTLPLTIEAFWNGTKRKGAASLLRFLQRALQNKRGNQCVAKSSRSPQNKGYHTRDINAFAYDACRTLVQFAHRYGVHMAAGRSSLPGLKQRTEDSKKCGCRSRAKCSGTCIYKDGACIPRGRKSVGFEGTDIHPGQRVNVRSPNAATRTRRAATTRRTAAALRDPDTAVDIAAGNSPTMRYVTHADRVWRVPGPKVRLPIR